MPRLLLPLLGLLLGACQTDNPYHGVSPVAPAAADERGQAPGIIYPAEPTDFSAYRTWRWQRTPAGSAAYGPEQIAEILSAALDQRGLRPAASDASDGLLVDVEVSQASRLRQMTPAFDAHYGYGYGHPGYDRYGLYGHPPMLRSYRVEVTRVELRLIDATSGRLVWHTRGEAPSGERVADSEALRQAMARALQDYPPH